MKKLLLTLFAITFAMVIFGQQDLYSDSKTKVQYTIEKQTDAVNDVFYEYYSFEITNISQEEISFIPYFEYKTDEGDLRSTKSGDVNEVLKLAAGETIKGKLADRDNLTLFKEFLIGNSGKKAANSTITVQSASINYQ